MKPLAPLTLFFAICMLVLCGLTIGCGGSSSSGSPVLSSVSNSSNPLVAQFKAAAACPGQVMVEFGPDTNYGRSTSWSSTNGGYSPTTILVAGMKASSTYHMRSQLQCADGETSTGPDLTFTTGALPSDPFPKITVTRPNQLLASTENPGIESIDIINSFAPGPPNSIRSFYTDREGNPIWYYDVGATNFPYTMKLLPDGNILLSIGEASGTSLLREVDLAGNTIREMDIPTLGAKLQAAGYDFVPDNYHHDFLPLANGHVVVLTNFSRPFNNLPGYPGTTNVIGDALIDLDQNWNPVWAWNSFDFPNTLSLDRHLNGLPDWTHSNAIIYSPSDGNLILSMRHQSWLLKIDYNNGTGTGNILWRLGYQGDFALTDGDVPSIDPSDWFSFQHFPSLISQSGSETTLAIWDNGDLRVTDSSGTTCATPPQFLPCYSRATVFQVDESAKVANILWKDLPGLYSLWGGSINQLENGNVEFDVNSPYNPPNPTTTSEVQEVSQSPTPTIIWQMDISAPPMYAYRAYRVPSLYNGVTWQF